MLKLGEDLLAVEEDRLHGDVGDQRALSRIADLGVSDDGRRLCGVGQHRGADRRDAPHPPQLQFSGFGS